MKNIAKYIFIITTFLFICSCQSYNMEHVETSIEWIGIKNQNVVILSNYYMQYDRVPGPLGDTHRDYMDFTRLLEINIDTKEQRVVGDKNLGGHKGIVCHNNIVCIAGEVFLDAENYNQIYKNDIPNNLNFFDFTSDLNRVLYNGWQLKEINFSTTNSTEIISNNVTDAKYCPTDDTLIAYVGRSTTADNMAGDLYLVESDGTNIVNILSGRNIIKIYWKPDGNTIVFLNTDGIWKIDKDGSNLTKILDLSLPEVYRYPAIGFGLFAYIDSNDKLVTVRF